MLLVAQEYGISMFLLVKRAQLSGIISASLSKEFYINASSAGWRKNEPVRMNVDAIDDELLSPTGLRYPKLSIYDRIALSIDKVRKIVLLTGDGALRKTAKSENVNILGTIGILDQLLDGNFACWNCKDIMDKKLDYQRVK